MNIEIISTGDEVLTGFIVDTNAAYLAQELLSLGLYVTRQNTVSDKLDDLINILKERSKTSNLIFVNGGLGPTSDDNTNLAAARALNVEQELNTMWLERMETWHKDRNREMPKTNIKQAMLPKGATLIDNRTGTACGFMLKINKALCIFTPGVPSEFKDMLKNFILPYIKEHYTKKDNVHFVKRLFLFGVSESKLARELDDLELDSSITIGYRAAYPDLELKLICNNASDSAYNKALSLIKDKVKTYLICEDNYNLESRIKDLLDNKEIYIIDNCTHGLLNFDLSSYLNVKESYLYQDTLDESKKRAFIDKDKAFVIDLKKIATDKGIEFLFELYKDKEKIQSLHALLNLTLRNKEKETLNLLIKTFIYKTLTLDKMIEPDNFTVL